MSFIQDLLSQLSEYGLDPGSYMGISDFDPTDISSAFQTEFGLTQSDIPPGLFQGITRNALLGGLGKTYSPAIEAHGTSLLHGLRGSLSGKEGKQAYGGFAGSGQQKQYTQGARDVYGKEMSKVLSETGLQRTRSLQSVQDIVNQWVETATELKYP